jgi:hypothetical protein
MEIPHFYAIGASCQPCSVVYMTNTGAFARYLPATTRLRRDYSVSRHSGLMTPEFKKLSSVAATGLQKQKTS